MTVHPISPEGQTVRKRKAHKKSRAGCQNCKIRRIKCDEGKPTCQKCNSYNVACSYDVGGDDDLLSSMTGTFSIQPVKQFNQVHVQLAIFDALPLTISISKFPQTDLIRRLPAEDIDVLNRFQNSTISTLGTASTQIIYQREMIRLASNFPYLLHLVLTLTLMHDRHLHSPPPPQSQTEAYHWYKGTSLFNAVLSKPILPQEKDALWATAALLGAVAFACIDAKTPEEAWPLRPPTDTDLEWLRMSDGKKSVMKLADPYRRDSCFAEVRPFHQRDFTAMAGSDPILEALPVGFIDLFNLTPSSSTPESNPYHSAAAVLSRLLPIECNHHTILRYLSFISFVQPEYKSLLEQKDPRALLLLAYWFGKICGYECWWVRRRAVLECQSICIFLGRYHWHDVGIMKLLGWPRRMCGLTARGCEAWDGGLGVFEV